jgi:hypothetical protein
MSRTKTKAPSSVTFCRLKDQSQESSVREEGGGTEGYFRWVIRTATKYFPNGLQNICSRNTKVTQGQEMKERETSVCFKSEPICWLAVCKMSWEGKDERRANIDRLEKMLTDSLASARWLDPSGSRVKL